MVLGFLLLPFPHRSFLALFPTAEQTRKTRANTAETAANPMKSVLKRSVFLCYGVKTLEIRVFCREVK
jgi:hypothetical protein